MQATSLSDKSVIGEVNIEVSPSGSRDGRGGRRLPAECSCSTAQGPRCRRSAPDPALQSFATTGAVLLTLFWSYMEFERSSERMAALQALETALELKQGQFEERLLVVEAKEAELEAREDQLEESTTATRLALEAQLGALAARLAAIEARGPPLGGGGGS